MLHGSVYPIDIDEEKMTLWTAAASCSSFSTTCVCSTIILERVCGMWWTKVFIAAHSLMDTCTSLYICIKCIMYKCFKATRNHQKYYYLIYDHTTIWWYYNNFFAPRARKVLFRPPVIWRKVTPAGGKVVFSPAPTQNQEGGKAVFSPAPTQNALGAKSFVQPSGGKCIFSPLAFLGTRSTYPKTAACEKMHENF